MTRKEVQALLKQKGISQISIARMANVSPQAISLFLRRRFASKKLSVLLDQILGTTGAIR
jgi:transcriptional regulator with XRE-family HTH domain